MYLSHSNVGFGRYLHTFMAVGVRCAYSLMQGIAPMAVVYMYMTGGIGAPLTQLQNF
jgi:hypothetical protein